MSSISYCQSGSKLAVCLPVQQVCGRFLTLLQRYSLVKIKSGLKALCNSSPRVMVRTASMQKTHWLPNPADLFIITITTWLLTRDKENMVGWKKTLDNEAGNTNEKQTGIWRAYVCSTVNYEGKPNCEEKFFLNSKKSRVLENKWSKVVVNTYLVFSTDI